MSAGDVLICNDTHWRHKYTNCFCIVTQLSTNCIYSKRYSPVQGQIYLLKIASIYGNFTHNRWGGGGA